MFNNNFNIDIENIKNDLAIEGLTLSDEDVSLLKRFADINSLELLIKL